MVLGYCTIFPLPRISSQLSRDTARFSVSLLPILRTVYGECSALRPVNNANLHGVWKHSCIGEGLSNAKRSQIDSMRFVAGKPGWAERMAHQPLRMTDSRWDVMEGQGQAQEVDKVQLVWLAVDHRVPYENYTACLLYPVVRCTLLSPLFSAFHEVNHHLTPRIELRTLPNQQTLF